MNSIKNIINTISNVWSSLILPSIFTTIIIVVSTVLIGTVLGFGLSYLMTLWHPNGIRPNKNKYRIISFFINTIRSFPILVLIIALIPLTRKVIGTSLGTAATIFPLSIACTAFMAKLLENNFLSVDQQIIEAARSYGATDRQIFFYAIVKESVPNIVSTITLAIITYIAATTIAASVGGGGIGAVALTYGYQSFNYIILYFGVLVLFLMVNAVQWIGNKIYEKLVKD